ncbi:hypothetical protein [Sphingomonas sp.]|uniref:hypothetical protein n=1 Tax=Sphingomonas sp. TaxID=28214 RepID=UPI003567728F
MNLLDRIQERAIVANYSVRPGDFLIYAGIVHRVTRIGGTHNVCKRIVYAVDVSAAGMDDRRALAWSIGIIAATGAYIAFHAVVAWSRGLL